MYIILMSLCLVLLVLFYKNINRNYWKKRNIVQVGSNTWHFLLGKCALSEVYKDIYDNHASLDFVGTFIGFKPVLVLKNLEDIQLVLQADFQNFYARGYNPNPNDVLADNLLLVDDYRRWRLLRQKFSPVFTALKVKHMYNKIEKCSFDFVKYVENNKHVKENIFDALHKYISATISATVFGLDSQTENTMENPIVDIIFNSAESHVTFNIKFAILFFFPQLFSLVNLKLFGNKMNFIVSIINKVLSCRRELKEKRHDFIDICVELQSQGTMCDKITGFNLNISDEIIAAQALSFFIAGVETGANTMNFFLLELSNNPTILNKLHSEIDNIFDECNGNITMEEIEKMQYMDMIFSEVLRKYPPISLMQRMCVKDVILPGSNIRIEKGTLLIVPIYAIHMDKQYFVNPDLFDPERFAPGNASKITKFTYLPFGEGNRMCIGARFAQVQVKVGLAWLLRKYTLKGYNYKSEYFDPSFFAIRDSKARYDLVPRNIPGKAD